jgi:phage shock protein PspC (stress-responsive transcriptional regulator)
MDNPQPGMRQRMSSSESERNQRPRLVRSRRGRLIGGVCSGLGAHFDVDPILFRIAFVGLAIFSGVGIGLYLAILLLVPEEGASRAPIRLRRSSWRSVLGVVAVIVAAGIVLHAAGHAGLGGAWGFGERTYRPRTLSEVRNGYQLGAGRLEVDLREIAFPPGDTSLHVRLGVGELVVLVPHGVCVATRARIGGGYVGALERESGGLDIDWSDRPSPPPHTPRLVLDGRVGLGALLVADRPFDRGWNGWGGEGGSGFQPSAYGTNEACRPSVGASR